MSITSTRGNANMTGMGHVQMTRSTQQGGGCTQTRTLTKRRKQHDRKGAPANNAIIMTGRGTIYADKTSRRATQQGAHKQHEMQQSNKEHSMWANTNAQCNTMDSFLGGHVDAMVAGILVCSWEAVLADGS